MYQRIVAPIDGSETARRAFGFALETARENGAELIPLYVVDVPMIGYEAPGCDPSVVCDALMQEGQRLKADALAVMQREHVRGMPRIVETDVPGGDIAQRILDEVRATHADLVVMGTHGRRGVRRLVLGSVAERYMRVSCCPVLLIPGSTAQPAPVGTTADETDKESS
jgi:nucleotide-binding universal stress UspA family protein